MDVESLAVSKISEMIARCARLVPTITTNDKTPFTDGHIEVYREPKKSKAHWEGRVSVQVKGRSHTSKSGDKLSFQVSRTDLTAYQADRGVLYFVVAVSPKTGTLTPFYYLLAPFAIDALLRDATEGSDKISLELKRFPNDPTSIERIVRVALKSRDQVTSIGFDPALYALFDSTTIYSAEDLNLNAPLVLNPGSNDFVLIANTSDGFAIPLAGAIHFVPQEYEQRTSDVSIRSGQIVYEESTVRRITTDSFEIGLSEGLRLLMHDSDGIWSTTVNLTLDETLSNRLKAVEFFLSLIDTNSIELGGNALPFRLGQKDAEGDLREHLATLRELGALFDVLGVDKSFIKMSAIDKAQASQLASLHQAFVEKQEVESDSAQISRVIQSVGDWKVMFLVTTGASEGRWRLIDPFSPDSRHQFRYDNDNENDGTKSFPVTAYDIVEEEYLAEVLNLRLDQIVSAYEAIADFESTPNLANHRVLALIAAADNCPKRNDEFLTAAYLLNEWLIAERQSESHHRINRWQILSRRGLLTADDRRDVRALRRELARSPEPNADLLEVAFALLLSEAEEVEYQLAILPKARTELLKRWPIWKLYDGVKNAESDEKKASGSVP